MLGDSFSIKKEKVIKNTNFPINFVVVVAEYTSGWVVVAVVTVLLFVVRNGYKGKVS